MKHFLIAGLLSVGSALVLADETAHSLVPGDGTVDGHQFKEYQATWQHCMLQENSWTDGGTVTETATVIGPLLRHSQVTTRPDGIRSHSTSYLEHASLAPIHLEQRVTGPDGSLLGQSQRSINQEGYSGWSQRGADPKQAVQGKLNSKSFNGSLLGVPLATLNFSHDQYRFDAFMMMFDAHYEVIATLAGTEQLEHQGESPAVRLVDVEWRHDNGDIYPPGPDASGGRYWILAEDRPDLPRVVRYKTDTYVVEVLPQYCPDG